MSQMLTNQIVKSSLESIIKNMLIFTDELWRSCLSLFWKCIHMTGISCQEAVSWRPKGQFIMTKKHVTTVLRKFKASDFLVSHFWVKHSRKTHPTSKVLTSEKIHTTCFDRHSFLHGLIKPIQIREEWPPILTSRNSRGKNVRVIRKL